MDIAEIILELFIKKNRKPRKFKEIVSKEKELLQMLDAPAKKAYFELDSLACDSHVEEEKELLKFALDFLRSIFTKVMSA